MFAMVKNLKGTVYSYVNRCCAKALEPAHTCDTTGAGGAHASSWLPVDAVDRKWW